MKTDQVTFGNVVGFVLAILFALVIGVSMWALLVGEYMNTFMNEQTRHTVRIVGFAGVLPRSSLGGCRTSPPSGASSSASCLPSSSSWWRSAASADC